MSNMKDSLVQSPFRAETWSHDTHFPSTLGSLFSVQTLKQAAQKIAQARRGNGFQTRVVVGMLLSHAARNKRLTQPQACMRMRLPVMSNRIGVRLTIAN